MLRIDKNDYAVENCATQEFNNAIDNFITRMWRKSRSMNLKDVTSFIYDNVNKICTDDIDNVKYRDLKQLSRFLVNELNLDRSQATEIMIVDELYTISLFYNRCNTVHDDF